MCVCAFVLLCLSCKRDSMVPAWPMIRFAGGTEVVRVVSHRHLLCFRGGTRSAVVESFGLGGARLGNNLSCPQYIDAWLVLKPDASRTTSLSLIVSFPPDHVHQHSLHPDPEIDAQLARVANDKLFRDVSSKVCALSVVNESLPTKPYCIPHTNMSSCHR
jgi:hypothetical protein